jgi:hypothetical protein
MVLWLYVLAMVAPVKQNQTRSHRIDHRERSAAPLFGFAHKRGEHPTDIELDTSDAEFLGRAYGDCRFAATGRAYEQYPLGRIDTECAGFIRSHRIGTLGEPFLEQVETADLIHVALFHQFEDIRASDNPDFVFEDDPHEIHALRGTQSHPVGHREYSAVDLWVLVAIQAFMSVSL